MILPRQPRLARPAAKPSPSRSKPAGLMIRGMLAAYPLGALPVGVSSSSGGWRRDGDDYRASGFFFRRLRTREGARKRGTVDGIIILNSLAHLFLRNHAPVLPASCAGDVLR